MTIELEFKPGDMFCSNYDNSSVITIVSLNNHTEMAKIRWGGPESSIKDMSYKNLRESDRHGVKRFDFTKNLRKDSVVSTVQEPVKDLWVL